MAFAELEAQHLTDFAEALMTSLPVASWGRSAHRKISGHGLVRTTASGTALPSAMLDRRNPVNLT